MQIQSCSSPQLQGFQKETWEAQLGQDEAINGIQCWLITDQETEIIDTLFKVSKCKIAGGGGDGGGGGGGGGGESNGDGGGGGDGPQPILAQPENRSQSPTGKFVIVQGKGKTDWKNSLQMCSKYNKSFEKIFG